jgi:branched-chain amino acid transport system substrate-binding protein
MDQATSFDEGHVSPGDTFRVSVAPSGHVTPESGALPAEFLRRHPTLIDVAVSVLNEGVPRLSFFWCLGPREPMLRFTVTLDEEPVEEPLALVECVAHDSLPYQLTTRELDVLTLLVGGLSNNRVAERLVTSPRTVTTHVDRLLGKMGVPSRTAAATIALDEGLIRLPIPGGPEGFERLAIGRVTMAVRPPIPVPASRRIVRRPLVIGAALPLTGVAAADGQEMRRATELAIAETNLRGGIAGRRVDLLTVDVDLLSPVGVEEAFLRLAAEEVDVLTSGYLAHQQIAHSIAAEYGAPYLNAATLGSMVDCVADEPIRFERVFQVCPSDVHYGPGFIDFLSELRDRGGWRPSSNRLLVLQGAWDTSNLGYQQMVDLAARRGWDVDPLMHVEDSPQGWERAIEHVRRTAPAAVMLGHYFVDGTARFLRGFLADPPPTLVYSLYVPSIPQFREQLKSRAEGLLWATVAGTYSDPLARAFAERYVAMHGVIPGRSHAGIAYDRANIIVGAWSRVRNPRDFRSVANEIRSSVHRGVNGAYSFATPGQAAQCYPLQTRDPSMGQAHLVYQVQDGQHRIIAPDLYGDGNFRIPPWLAEASDHPGRPPIRPN